MALNSSLRLDYVPILPGRWLFNAGHGAVSRLHQKNSTRYDLLANTFNAAPGYDFGRFALNLSGNYTFVMKRGDYDNNGGGYPTTEVALKDPSKNLPGILASKPEAAFVIRNTNLRVFSVPNNDLLKIFASASASSNPDYSVTLSTNSLYPVTSGRELMPVYGSLRPDYKSDSYWIGQLNAFGAFEKTDGSIIQASMSGPVSGPYSSTQFSGTTAGTFVSTPFLSQLTADDRTAALKYYDGSTSGFTTDGELRGLLGATNPVTWTQNSTYPTYTDLQLAGVWWPSLETPVQRSHIFNFPMYPKNFTNGTYTTTTGASFWGYMGGIHQVVNTGNSQDGFEANLATVFVDNNSKAGFLIGKIGGPDAWNPTSYWGFDFNNQAFHIDSNYQQATLVEIATTGITAAGLKDYLSSHSKQFTYLGGVSYDPTVTVPPEKIGAFYNSANSAVGTIYMEKSGSPLAGIATTNYMAAANGVSGLRISLAPTNKTLPMTTG